MDMFEGNAACRDELKVGDPVWCFAPDRILGVGEVTEIFRRDKLSGYIKARTQDDPTASKAWAFFQVFRRPAELIELRGSLNFYRAALNLIQEQAEAEAPQVERGK